MHDAFRDIVEHSHDAIIIIQGPRIRLANPQAALLSGFSEEELEGKRFLDFVHSDDRERLFQSGNSLRSISSFPLNYSFRMVARSGENRWLEAKLTRITWNGKDAALCFLQDMTEIRQVRALIKVKQDLAMTLASARSLDEALPACIDAATSLSGLEVGGIYLKDTDRRRFVLYAYRGVSNDVMTQLHDVTPDHPAWKLFEAEKPAFDYHPCADFPPDHPICQESLITTAIVPIRFQGEVIGCFNMASRFLDSTPYTARPMLEAVAAQVANVIVKLQAEEKRSALALRLSTLLQNLHSGVLVEDETRHIALVNQEFCSLFGIPVPPESLIGSDCSKSAEETKALFADPDRFVENINGILAAQKPVRGEEIELADGHIYQRDYIPIFIDHDYRGHLWQYRDITQRKRAEFALKLARDEADAANRSKSDFLARMSHEIRTPMAAIIGYAEMLDSVEVSNPHTTEISANLRRNARHLHSLISDILDLSKIEAGHMQIERQQVNPFEIIEDVTSVMRVRAQEKSLTFNTEYETSLPETILTDPVRFRQILINLVSNAIKYTESGHVNILTRCVPVAVNSDDIELQVTIEDTGPGIPDELLEDVFSPFFQGKLPDNIMKPEGTGLGLSIARQLADLLGGEIVVETAVGKGSSFTFHLLLDSAFEYNFRETPVRTEKEEEDKFEEFRELSGVRVLVAEDGADNRQIIDFYLSKAGMKADYAANGREAVDKAIKSLDRDNPYDIVLMDMLMPEMDGYEATAQLRAVGYKSPVIALTALATKEDRNRSLKAGCDAFLTKPIHRTELYQTLLSFLQQNGAAKTKPKPVSSVKVSYTPPIDQDMLPLVLEYVNAFPLMIKELKKLMKEQDAQELQVRFHRLQGSAGGYGFSQLAVLARETEAELHSQKGPGDTKKVNRVISEMENIYNSREMLVQAS